MADQWVPVGTCLEAQQRLKWGTRPHVGEGRSVLNWAFCTGRRGSGVHNVERTPDSPQETGSEEPPSFRRPVPFPRAQAACRTGFRSTAGDTGTTWQWSSHTRQCNHSSGSRWTLQPDTGVWIAHAGLSTTRIPTKWWMAQTWMTLRTGASGPLASTDPVPACPLLGVVVHPGHCLRSAGPQPWGNTTERRRYQHIARARKMGGAKRAKVRGSATRDAGTLV